MIENTCMCRDTKHDYVKNVLPVLSAKGIFSTCQCISINCYVRRNAFCTYNLRLMAANMKSISILETKS